MKLGTYWGTGWINEATALRGRLTVTQEQIDISTRGPKADRSWMFVDAAGHFHAMSGKDYPTLRSKEIPQPCDGSCGGICEGEGYSVTRWSCIICGEAVEPGLVPGPHYETIPGMVDWYAELEGPADAAAQRLAMGAEQVMLRFDADGPERVTFFGTAFTGDSTISSTFGDGIEVSLRLSGMGALGDRPRAAEKVKAA